MSTTKKATTAEPDASPTIDYEQATKHPMDWIYAHVHEEDRPRLRHQFVEVNSVPPTEGGAEFIGYMSIAWVFIAADGEIRSIVSAYADSMVAAVTDPHGRKYPERVLTTTIRNKLGARILPGHYDPIEGPVVPVVPVGKPWPEQGPDIYHTTSGLSESEYTSVWEDARGKFFLQSARSPLGPWYYYYRKVA